MQVLKNLSTASAEATVIRRETGRYFHALKGAMQKVSLLAVGTLLTSAFSTPALGLTLDGATDFRYTTGAAGAGGATSSTSTLNTNTGRAGFDSFFTSDFGRLGTSDVSILDGQYNAGAVYRSISNPLQFTSSTTTVSFNYAFDGEIGTDLGRNTFKAYLALSSSPQTAIGSGFSTTTRVNPGGASGQFNVSSLNTNSTYVVAFELDEVSSILGTDNFGAGFDNVNVSNAVPFEFSPSMGILALGAWGAFSQLKGKLKNRKPLNIGSLTTNDGQA